MTHSFATVVIPFRPYTLAIRNIKDILSKMDAPACIPISKMLDDTDAIHFMSINIIADTIPGKAHLLIEVTADGCIRDALSVVARVLYEPLTTVLRIMGCGRDLDGTADALARFLIRKHHAIGQDLFAGALGLAFDGSPGMTVKRLREEEKLATRIGRMHMLSSTELTPRQKLEEIRHMLWHDDSAKWAFVAEATPMLEPARTPISLSEIISLRQFRELLGPAFRDLLWPLPLLWILLWILFGWLFRSLGWIGAISLGLVPATVPFIVAIYLIASWARCHLNKLEATDPAPDEPPHPRMMEKVMRSEGRCAQGLLASVSTLKPGRFRSLFRRLALRAAFWFIGQANARYVRPGFLGQIADIHFARWFLLPGSDKLFFWSNYDGAWESYVEDFIQLGHQGVSAIWSNTRNFPRTHNLSEGGASDGNRLRRWARVQMYPPQFWYSAYPSLTLERTRRNAAIRQGIASARTDFEAEDWLSLFGSAPAPRPAGEGSLEAGPVPSPPAVPPPVPRLDPHEVPTLVFGGRRHLPHAICLVIRMSDSPDNCRKWLREVEPHITYGEDKDLTWALAFALSTTGFDRLALWHTDLDTFPAIFRNGVTSPVRSVALGDAGEDAPEKWAWGNRCNPADALLLVYAKRLEVLTDRVRYLVDLAEAHGQTAHTRIELQMLPPNGEPTREPFGFVDGISQPLLRDTPRGRAARNAIHVVEPGEFVLGYPDNSGYYPSTPTVAGGRDPAHRLAEYITKMPTLRPAFGSNGSDGRRDLGRNGTYLVVRQLEQNVEGFEDWLTKAAIEAKPLLAAQAPSLNHRRELIAAKIMGRWRSDGSSLTRRPDHPHAQPHRHNQPYKQPDNDFRYGLEDPQGLRCPFGAHMRRANPRDSLDPANSDAALRISNRHRILRVSRRYQEVSNKTKEGTLFMCLNADIERQFEFVQQTYLRARNFQALDGEVDPAAVQKPKEPGHPRQFTIPTRSGPLVLQGLPDFVRVRGGGYFFMPARRTVSFLVNYS